MASRVLSDNTCQLIENLVMTLNQKAQQMDTVGLAAPLNADLRALYLVYSNVDVPIAPPDALVSTLVCLQAKVRAARPPRLVLPTAAPEEPKPAPDATAESSKLAESSGENLLSLQAVFHFFAVFL